MTTMPEFTPDTMSGTAPPMTRHDERWTWWGFPPRPDPATHAYPSGVLHPSTCCGRKTSELDGRVLIANDPQAATCRGIDPPDVAPRTSSAWECRGCWQDVIPRDGVIPLHGRRDRRPCPGSRQDVRDQVRPQAPDVEQEALRARAGFPWCDTCHLPATGGDRPTTHAVLSDGGKYVHGMPDYTDHGHVASMRQWDAAQ